MILRAESDLKNYTKCFFRNLIIRSVYMVKQPVINFAEGAEESRR